MTQTVWTPYGDLDALLAELVGHWERILGDNLAGAWIQGSFALGAGDLESDCDAVAWAQRYAVVTASRTL